MTAEKNGPVSDKAALPSDNLDEHGRRVVAAVAKGLPARSGPLAVLDELEAQSTRFESRFADGKLLWRRWGEPTAPRVLLLHGGGGSWKHYVRTIPALMRDYCVWIPDLPGYGESDLPSGPAAIGVVCDALAAGIDQLLPPGAFDVVGFSFGSVIGARLVQRYEQRVKRLVLIGPNFVSNMMGGRFEGIINWRRIDDPYESMAARHNNMRVTMIADAARIDELALHIYASDMLRQRFSPIALVDRKPPSDDVKAISPRVRVTGISGADDQVFASVMALQAGALDELRPGSRFHPIPNASHWVMYEAPEELNRAVLAALSERLPAA